MSRNWNHTLGLILYEFNNKWDGHCVCEKMLDFFVLDKEVPTHSRLMRKSSTRCEPR